MTGCYERLAKPLQVLRSLFCSLELPATYNKLIFLKPLGRSMDNAKRMQTLKKEKKHVKSYYGIC